MANSFSNSVFTTVGKQLFSSEAGINLSFNKFKLAATYGLIESSRTSQTNIKFADVVTSATKYEDGDSVGYQVTLRISSGALSTPFNIEEVGLYSNNNGVDVLSWVGKPDVAIAYTSKTDVTIVVLIPIEDQDIKIDVDTNPKRLSDHNNDINSHPYLKNLLKDAGLLDNRSDGKMFLQINDVNITSPVVGNFYYKAVDGRFSPALADGTDKANAVGFYTETDATHKYIRFGGLYTKVGAFETGKVYYLSTETAGGLTTESYSGAVKIGTGLDSNTLYVDIDKSPSESSSGGEFLEYQTLLQDSSEFSELYYDVFKTTNSVVSTGVYSSPDSMYTLTNNQTVLTGNILEGVDADDDFFVYQSSTNNLQLEYSINGGTTFVISDSDRISLDATTTDLRLRFTNKTTEPIDFYSFGVLYGKEGLAFESMSVNKMLEVLSLTQDYIAGTTFNIPNNLSYTFGAKALEIQVNGITLVQNLHYEEVDKWSVKFLIALKKNDIVVFTEFYGYVDTSIENSQRLDNMDVDLYKAAKGIYHKDIGTANNVILTNELTDIEAELFDGMTVIFTPKYANTGATTLKIKNLDAKPVYYGGVALTSGFLEVNSKYIAIYSASTGVFHLEKLNYVFEGSNFLTSGQAGYMRFPKDTLGRRLIIQWGVISTISTGVGTRINLPIAFPNSPLVVTGTHNGGGSSTSAITAINCDRTTVYANHSNPSSIEIAYIALGY